MKYRIIETDNFGGDYPDETFVLLPLMERSHAHAVAQAINAGFSEQYPRYWREVTEDYVLQGGFEP